MQAVCHLLSNVESYCKESLPGLPSFDLTRLDASNDGSERSLDCENMDLDNFPSQEVTPAVGTRKRACKRVSFHLHVPKVLDELAEGISLLLVHILVL